jgi:hypothetical protein
MDINDSFWSVEYMMYDIVGFRFLLLDVFGFVCRAKDDSSLFCFCNILYVSKIDSFCLYFCTCTFFFVEDPYLSTVRVRVTQKGYCDSTRAQILPVTKTMFSRLLIILLVVAATTVQGLAPRNSLALSLKKEHVGSHFNIINKDDDGTKANASSFSTAMALKVSRGGGVCSVIANLFVILVRNPGLIMGMSPSYT